MTEVKFGWWLTQTPKFINHWTNLNAARVANGEAVLLTRDGQGIADLSGDFAALTQAQASVNSKGVAAGIERARRDGGKVSLRADFEGWQKAVAYNLSHSAYDTRVPTLPALNDGEKAFLDQLDAAARLWGEIDAATGVPNFTPPLVTRSGQTRAEFAAKVNDLRDFYAQTPILEGQADILRRERDGVATAIHDACANYIAAVENAYAPDSPLRVTLPLLSPKSNHTPGAVSLTGTFDPQTGTALLGWTPSAEPDLGRYSVRICAGPRYKVDDEATIADITPPTTTYTIPAIYLPTGGTVWAKVYVILDNGQEKGSDAVKVSAPV